MVITIIPISMDDEYKLSRRKVVEMGLVLLGNKFYEGVSPIPGGKTVLEHPEAAANLFMASVIKVNSALQTIQDRPQSDEQHIPVGTGDDILDDLLRKYGPDYSFIPPDKGRPFPGYRYRLPDSSVRTVLPHDKGVDVVYFRDERSADSGEASFYIKPNILSQIRNGALYTDINNVLRVLVSWGIPNLNPPYFFNAVLRPPDIISPPYQISNITFTEKIDFKKTFKFSIFWENRKIIDIALNNKYPDGSALKHPIQS